jgi:hypothetical protein
MNCVGISVQFLAKNLGLDSAYLFHQFMLICSELLVLEQVCVAALDCNRLEVADACLKALFIEFPTSLRIRKLKALKLEALERYVSYET